MSPVLISSLRLNILSATDETILYIECAGVKFSSITLSSVKLSSVKIFSAGSPAPDFLAPIHPHLFPPFVNCGCGPLSASSKLCGATLLRMRWP